MEEAINTLATNGGPLGVLAAAVVYLIIYLQRKNTSEKRNEDTDQLRAEMATLKDELNTLKNQKQLIEKDVTYLLSETNGIKEDIKEMKNTLNTIALALERIAAKYDDK